MTTTIIITGSRDGFPNFEQAFGHTHQSFIDRAGSLYDIQWLHGAARGVDTQFDDLMVERHRDNADAFVTRFPAKWRRADGSTDYTAGFQRNQAMLDHGECLAVFAFKANFDRTLSRGGTEHMVRIARAANVPCYITTRTERFLWK